MNLSTVASYVGSAVAVVAGSIGVLSGISADPPPAQAVAVTSLPTDRDVVPQPVVTVIPTPPSSALPTASLLAAIAGLATAIGPQVFGMMRLYIEERKAERDASVERHDLLNRLNLQNLRLLDMEATVTYNRNLIELLSKRDTAPTDAHPDRHEEFKAAMERSAPQPQPPPIGS